MSGDAPYSSVSNEGGRLKPRSQALAWTDGSKGRRRRLDVHSMEALAVDCLTDEAWLKRLVGIRSDYPFYYDWSAALNYYLSCFDSVAGFVKFSSKQFLGSSKTSMSLDDSQSEYSLRSSEPMHVSASYSSVFSKLEKSSSSSSESERRISGSSQSL